MRLSRLRGIWVFGMLLATAVCHQKLAFADSSQCTPEFHPEQGKVHGWLGADAAYSIPLGDGRDLWIFGDTLEGRRREVHDSTPVMVRNSIGISTCAKSEWQIHYHIRQDATGKAADFFTSQHPGTWYWAMDGIRVGSDVWVTLLCVRATDAKSAMGFETCGTDLARIEALGPDPQKWKITYQALVPDGTHAYPSATAVVVGNSAYLFAQDELRAKPLIVGRVPLDKLADSQRNIEYLSEEGKWAKGFDPAHAHAVMSPGISELSIRYHPELKRWLAVMFAPGMFSRNIELRSAPTATGPWSSGQVIYTVPEMQPGRPGYDKDTFCYAGKEHPEFERGDLVFTYVCNTFAVPKLATESYIYFPQVVRMKMPPLDEKGVRGDAGKP